MSEGGRSRGRYGRGCVHVVLREKCVLSLREKKAPREEIVYTFHTLKYLSLGGMESIWNDGLFTVVTIVKENHNFITLYTIHFPRAEKRFSTAGTGKYFHWKPLRYFRT